MSKTIDANIEEIKKLLKEEKILIGTESVLKALRANKISKVFIAGNCKEQTQSDITQYSKLNKIGVVKLGQPSDELGIICKKPFSISVLGVTR